jgi:hypothetical protein
VVSYTVRVFDFLAILYKKLILININIDMTTETPLSFGIFLDTIEFCLWPSIKIIEYDYWLRTIKE